MKNTKMNTQLEKTMPAYMLAFVRVEDYEAFNKVYLEKAVEIVSRHGGVTFAVADNPPVIEGSLPEGRLVILEFPSKEAAFGFYNDPEYQPLKKVRKEMSSSDSTIFERGF